MSTDEEKKKPEKEPVDLERAKRFYEDDPEGAFTVVSEGDEEEDKKEDMKEK